MSRSPISTVAVAFGLISGAAAFTACATSAITTRRTPASAASDVALGDLAAQMRNGKVSMKNRVATVDAEGDRMVQRLDERPGAGVLWLPGPDFEEGMIEADVRGRDQARRSFVGLAFGGNGDEYEAVYLRPFLFRSSDLVARSSALQYMSLPSYDWKRLRSEYPGPFERALVNPPAATEWVHLRVVVDWAHVRAYIDGAETPVIDVERIAAKTRGRVGLWAGDGSDATFSNIRITRVR